MIKRTAFNSFSWRNAFSVAAAVFIAVFVDRYYSFTHACWILMTAYIVGQTTRGTPLRQSHFRFLAIVTANLVCGALMSIAVRQGLYYCMIGILFVLGAQTMFLCRQRELNMEKAIVFFLASILIGTLSPENFPVYQRLIDVVLGMVIGLSCSLVFIPFRLEQEFCDGVAAILHVLNDYSQSLLKRIDHSGENTKTADADLSLLLKYQSGYPEWVFEVGFNPGLRGGFRFFLINLDRVTELFISLDYLVNQTDAQLLQQISACMSDAVRKNQELLEVMHKYFLQNKLEHSSPDYTRDIAALEKELSLLVPGNMELLDVSPDNLFLTAIVRDIKDLRHILLQLIMSLPATVNEAMK